MTIRRLLLLLASAALAVALIIVLIRLGKVDLHATLHQLARVSSFNFVKLALLNVALVYLSTEKWRSVDLALRSPSDSVPSRIASFFVSSAGMALGLVLPVQIGMTIARTISASAYGRALKRGTGGTLLEQAFDFIVVICLSIVSAITLCFRAGGLFWLVSAITLIVLMLLLVSPLVRKTGRFCHFASDSAVGMNYFPSHKLATFARSKLRSVSEVMHSGHLDARLARRLVVLSLARFAVVVLMASQTAIAIDVSIPLWRMAAAIPFVSLANLISITPGGIGFNELTSATALPLFGTPFALASQWALANRLLCTASCFVVAICAFIALGADKTVSSRWPEATKTHQSRINNSIGRN